jgi:peptidoglycan hydrolase CwlO-like protein
VSSASVYRWVEELSAPIDSKPFSVQEKDREIQRLQRELQSYKEIIAEKELSLRIKDALLKKIH